MLSIRVVRDPNEDEVKSFISVTDRRGGGTIMKETGGDSDLYKGRAEETRSGVEWRGSKEQTNGPLHDASKRSAFDGRGPFV